jgi:competence protein ComEA
MKMMNRLISILFLACAASAQQLPDGPGRVELEKMCRQCHELARSISLRQDRDGWSTTISKMVAFGMKANDRDLGLVIDYLVKNYPAEDVPRINVNKATAIELESGLSLRRSQAASVLDYRAKHGDFKSLDDLKKVPLIDADKIDAKKDRIAF